MAEVDIVEIMARADWGGPGYDHLHKRDKDDCRRQMLVILRALDAAGFRVAPAEPTLEMIEAAMPEAVKPLQGAVWGQRDRIEAIYAAMITTGNLAGRK